MESNQIYSSRNAKDTAKLFLKLLTTETSLHAMGRPQQGLKRQLLLVATEPLLWKWTMVFRNHLFENQLVITASCHRCR